MNIKDKAKELGIKNYGQKKEETLLKEIAELETKELTVNEKIEICGKIISDCKDTIEKEQDIMKGLLKQLTVKIKPLHEQLAEQKIVNKMIKQKEADKIKENLKELLKNG